MCTYNAISLHTYQFEIQKKDSEESLLTFVNLFPRNIIIIEKVSMIGNATITHRTNNINRSKNKQ